MRIDFVQAGERPPAQGPGREHGNHDAIKCLAIAIRDDQARERDQHRAHEHRIGNRRQQYGPHPLPVRRLHQIGAVAIKADGIRNCRRALQQQTRELRQSALLTQTQPHQRRAFQREYAGAGASRERERHRERGETDREDGIRFDQRPQPREAMQRAAE